MNYNFADDVVVGEGYEKLVLAKIKRKYPLVYKREGYFKDYDLYIPETNESVEVKFDLLSEKTGNFFFEVASDDRPSGLFTSKSDFYIICNTKEMFFFSTDHLINLSKDYRLLRSGSRGSDASRTGFLLKRNYIIELVEFDVVRHCKIEGLKFDKYRNKFRVSDLKIIGRLV